MPERDLTVFEGGLIIGGVVLYVLMLLGVYWKVGSWAALVVMVFSIILFVYLTTREPDSS